MFIFVNFISFLNRNTVVLNMGVVWCSHQSSSLIYTDKTSDIKQTICFNHWTHLIVPWPHNKKVQCSNPVVPSLSVWSFWTWYLGAVQWLSPTPLRDGLNTEKKFWYIYMKIKVPLPYFYLNYIHLIPLERWGIGYYHLFFYTSMNITYLLNKN